MTKKSLSAEIAENITELKKLKAINPSRKLSNRLQEMYDALHEAQGKEWEAQVEKYKEAKDALDKAKQTAQNAINDLAKTAEAIDKAANAFKAVLAALPFAL
jgi:ABC-type transporter Mla subunit MlaD